MYIVLQLNLSTTATLGTQKSGHCREVAVIVERLKQEWMHGLSAKKKAIVEKWPLVEVWQGYNYYFQPYNHTIDIHMYSVTHRPEVCDI